MNKFKNIIPITDNDRAAMQKYMEASELRKPKVFGHQVKIAREQKEAIEDLCHSHNMRISEFIRNGLDVWIYLFPYRSKLTRHRRLIRDILKNLD